MPFWTFQKILKNHRIRISKFWSIIFLRLCLLCIVKKFDSIRTKLTEEIHFEVCHSGNPPADRSVQRSGSRRQRCADPEMLRLHHSADSDHRSANWGHSELQGAQSGRKTNRLVSFCCVQFSFLTPSDWLGRTSLLKWPILCRVERKTLTQSVWPWPWPWCLHLYTRVTHP